MRSHAIIALAVGGLLAGGAALARDPAPPTLLKLSETAMVERTPGEVRATLRAESRGSDSRAVQTQVNRSMTQALEAARKVPGVRASTSGYWTSRNDKDRIWVASQSLTLQGSDAGPLLELAGVLQGQGLTMAGLDWSLSAVQRLEARQEAGRLAVDALRARAEAVARQLGLQVQALRELRLDAPDQAAPRFRAAAAPMAARADGAPPPVSAPEPEMVSATAEADFLLAP